MLLTNTAHSHTYDNIYVQFTYITYLWKYYSVESFPFLEVYVIFYFSLIKENFIFYHK